METKNTRNFSNKKITGQGMSEYLVIVGLLAVAGIAAMGFMGSSIRSTMLGFASEMAGDKAGQTQNQGQGQSEATTGGGFTKAGLDDYRAVNDNL